MENLKEQQNFKSLLANYKSFLSACGMTYAHGYIVGQIEGTVTPKKEISDLNRHVLVPFKSNATGMMSQVNWFEWEPQDFGKVATTVDSDGIIAAARLADSLWYSIVAVPSWDRFNWGDIKDRIVYKIYAEKNKEVASEEIKKLDATSEIWNTLKQQP